MTTEDGNSLFQDNHRSSQGTKRIIINHKMHPNKIKEDEMSRTCGTHERQEKCVQYFNWETQREETTRKTEKNTR